MFVLVIGRIELMIITENQAVDISERPSNDPNSARVMSGVSSTVKKIMARIPVQFVYDLLFI